MPNKHPTKQALLIPTAFKVLFGFIVLCACSFTAFASHENNGLSNYPIWSELSYFERSTLDDLSKAHNNEPDALLALYLLASGVRELSDFDSVQKKIDSFTESVQTLIIDKDNSELMGAILNREMHSTFFNHGNQESQTARGYSAEQSRLMGIFEDGTFNCISSSLLYAVLARTFGLNVEGVLLPTHAFVQLNLNGGQEIDVETTSPEGFNQTHNEAFYEEQNKDWSTERNLDPIPYQDYLNRTRVSPTLLAAQNMLNQHTGPSEMPPEDSGRLAEISAYIDPKNLTANEKRLYFYGTEINTLIKSQQWPILLRLYNTSYQQIMLDSIQFPDVAGLQHNLQLYLSGALLAYAHAGDIEQTLTVMGELLDNGLTAPEHQTQINKRVANGVNILLKKLVAQQQYDEGLLVLSLLEGHLNTPSTWPSMLSWFYSQWVKESWDNSDWPEAIAILIEYLDHPSPHLERGRMIKSLGSAYQNWVMESLQNKNLEVAAIAVEQCISSQHRPACSKAQSVYQKTLEANAHEH